MTSSRLDILQRSRHYIMLTDDTRSNSNNLSHFKDVWEKYSGGVRPATAALIAKLLSQTEADPA